MLKRHGTAIFCAEPHKSPPRTIEELKEMEFSIGKVKVQARFVNHPGICAGYRLETTSGSIAYLPDNEPYDSLKVALAERERSDVDRKHDDGVVERRALVRRPRRRAHEHRRVRARPAIGALDDVEPSHGLRGTRGLDA